MNYIICECDSAGHVCQYYQNPTVVWKILHSVRKTKNGSRPQNIFVKVPNLHEFSESGWLFNWSTQYFFPFRLGAIHDDCIRMYIIIPYERIRFVLAEKTRSIKFHKSNL